MATCLKSFIWSRVVPGPVLGRLAIRMHKVLCLDPVGITLLYLLTATMYVHGISAGVIHLNATNFILDGAHHICSKVNINFTCTGIDLMTVQRWELIRSGHNFVIADFFGDSMIGPATTIQQPGFSAYLSDVSTDPETMLMNFTSSLQINLSQLMNGNDTIVCRDIRSRSGLLVSYIPIGACTLK